MSNTWLKHSLTCREYKTPMSTEESRKMYYHLRTDRYSVMYVDFWACLVLIARYGELPNFRNVPNNKDGLQRRMWNIHKGLVRHLLEASDIKVDVSSDILEKDVCFDDLCTAIENRDLQPTLKVEEIKIQIKKSAKELVLLIDWADDKNDQFFS